jgi:hypothetical protein
MIEKIKSVVVADSVSAMALNIENDNHPNKMPFKGILTRIGKPSDAPPDGSFGKNILITVEAAQEALHSLLGMAIDYTSGYDGHDVKTKIGIITSADIEGDAITIAGFFYGADFPVEGAEIKAKQEELGFSYEARNLYSEDYTADPIVVNKCTFTGAAVLLKHKAAYKTTSIQAKAEEDSMDDNTKKLIEDMASQIASLSAAVETMQNEKINANAAVKSLVQPHVDALMERADKMTAEGVGGHPSNGHAEHLRKMAACMCAEAAMGKVPHEYNSYFNANEATTIAAKAEEIEPKVDIEMTKDELNSALTPILDKLAAMEAKLNEKVAEIDTKVVDLKAAAVRDASPPTRQTFSPEVTKLLAKAGLGEPEGDNKLSTEKLDAAIKSMGLNIQQSLKLKAELFRAGAIN